MLRSRVAVVTTRGGTSEYCNVTFTFTLALVFLPARMFHLYKVRVVPELEASNIPQSSLSSHTARPYQELVDQVEQHHTSGIAASASVRDRRKGCFASGTTAGHHGVRRERAATGLLQPVQSRQAGILSLAYMGPTPPNGPQQFHLWCLNFSPSTQERCCCNRLPYSSSCSQAVVCCNRATSGAPRAMRAAQALRQHTPGAQPTEPRARTSAAPANAALSRLLYFGTREACAEAARASLREACVARAAASGAQMEPRRQLAGPTSCSGRRWPGELRRQVAAERDPLGREDFFDRLARAEARDEAVRIAIQATLTTSVAASTSPSPGRWRLSSPVGIRPSGEQPRPTSPVMRAARALQRRFGSPFCSPGRTVEITPTCELYDVGRREARAEGASGLSTAEAAPGLYTAEVESSRKVAPIDSAPTAKPEATLTAAKEKTVQGGCLEADSQVSVRLKGSARKLTVKSKPFWETRQKSKSQAAPPGGSTPTTEAPVKADHTCAREVRADAEARMQAAVRADAEARMVRVAARRAATAVAVRDRARVSRAPAPTSTPIPTLTPIPLPLPLPLTRRRSSASQLRSPLAAHLTLTLHSQKGQQSCR